MFCNSLDHVYKQSFQNKNSETIAELFAKNLINDRVHYSLFLQNNIEGADKSSAGERVTICNSHYLFIGFRYTRGMYLLLFLLSDSTY